LFQAAALVSTRDDSDTSDDECADGSSDGAVLLCRVYLVFERLVLVSLVAFLRLLQSAMGLSRNDTHGSSENRVGAKRSVDLTFEQQRALHMSKRVADGLGEQLGAENLEPANSVVEDAVSFLLLCSYSFSYTNHASHYFIRLEHMSDGGTSA